MITAKEGKRLYDGIYRFLECEYCGEHLVVHHSDVEVYDSNYLIKCCTCGHVHKMSIVDFNRRTFDCKLDGSRL